MNESTCPNCGSPVVEGRLNCPKCGTCYPDITERELTWDPTKEDAS